MNTTADAVVISAPAIASGWRASAARGTDGSLLQALHVRDERVDVCGRQLAVFVLHRRLLGRFDLRRLRDRIDDPRADLLGRQFRADAIQRTRLVALAGDGMTQRAFLGGVDFLSALDLRFVLRSRRERRQRPPGRRSGRQPAAAFSLRASSTLDLQGRGELRPAYQKYLKPNRGGMRRVRPVDVSQHQRAGLHDPVDHGGIESEVIHPEWLV